MLELMCSISLSWAVLGSKHADAPVDPAVPMEGGFLMDLEIHATHQSARKEQDGGGQGNRNVELPRAPLCCLNTPRTGEAELRVLSDLSSALPSPHPFFSKIRAESVVLCFLSLGALLPFCHCLGPCSKKSHLVSFCVPVCFSSLLVFTHHFWSFTLCQYLLSLPIFSFLNHFIPFPAHPNQHYFESHISFFILA